MTGPIELVAYDSRWPSLFDAEAVRLRDVLGALALRMDHNGSTSIPGLGAKPVIDIQVSVAALQPMAAYAEPLRRLGYVHVPDPDDSFCPFFHRPAQWPHTHHVHVVEAGGAEERRTLAFRDYLRDHAAAAGEYERLKRDLAGQFAAGDHDAREAYARAKADFIERIIAVALGSGYPLDQFQARLDDWRARANVPLAVAAVRRDGSLVWRGASAAGGDAASPTSQFPIYSITKTLTAACLLRLDQSGVLRVDDPIAKWISDRPVPRAMTISHLLCHTAGVPDYGPLREYHDAVRTTPSAPWTDDQFLAATLAKGVLFAPGAGWAYSNAGYLLLRRAIERATGRSYRDAIADQIAHPLGLARTFVAETIDDWRCCVPGYGREVSADGAVVDVRSTYHPGWCAPGVAISTVDDVTLFYDALFGGALLDEPHLNQMLHLTRVRGSHPPAVTPSYGMGIMADPDGPYGPSYGHGGGGPGYSLFAGMLPGSPTGRLSVAVFCNSSLGADAGQGVNELFHAAAGRPFSSRTMTG